MVDFGELNQRKRDEAYWQGWEARMKNESDPNNPYHGGAYRDEWNRGWDEASEQVARTT